MARNPFSDRDWLKLPSSLRFVLVGAATVACSSQSPSSATTVDASACKIQVPVGDVCTTYCEENGPDAGTPLTCGIVAYCNPTTSECYTEDGGRSGCVYTDSGEYPILC